MAPRGIRFLRSVVALSVLSQNLFWETLAATFTSECTTSIATLTVANLDAVDNANATSAAGDIITDNVLDLNDGAKNVLKLEVAAADLGGTSSLTGTSDKWAVQLNDIYINTSVSNGEELDFKMYHVNSSTITEVSSSIGQDNSETVTGGTSTIEAINIGSEDVTTDLNSGDSFKIFIAAETAGSAVYFQCGMWGQWSVKIGAANAGNNYHATELDYTKFNCACKLAETADVTVSNNDPGATTAFLSVGLGGCTDGMLDGFLFIEFGTAYGNTPVIYGLPAEDTLVLVDASGSHFTTVVSHGGSDVTLAKGKHMINNNNTTTNVIVLDLTSASLTFPYASAALTTVEDAQAELKGTVWMRLLVGPGNPANGAYDATSISNYLQDGDDWVKVDRVVADCDTTPGDASDTTCTPAFCKDGGHCDADPGNSSSSFAVVSWTLLSFTALAQWSMH